jgi:hypothetical protein
MLQAAQFPRKLAYNLDYFTLYSILCWIRIEILFRNQILHRKSGSVSTKQKVGLLLFRFHNCFNSQFTVSNM